MSPQFTIAFFLGITTVLTLSTIALESRTDLPKVHYATALDWFIICSFGYCIATLLEFAGVHYFTKVSFKMDSKLFQRYFKMETGIIFKEFYKNYPE